MKTSKILKSDEIGLLLPNYKNIYVDIKEIRGEQPEGKVLTETEQSRNVFSILGDRGTGKTSILMTVYDQLTKEVTINCDLVMPIIYPERLSKNNSVLGWILENFKSDIEKFRKKVQDSEDFPISYKVCSEVNEESAMEEMRTMVNAFDELLRSYYLRDISIVNQAGNERRSISDIKSLASISTSYDKQLVENFRGFLDKYVSVKKRSNPESKPLIFMFFDDVDISSDFSMDIIKIIMNFLCSPYIVVMISGDYDVFLAEATLNFLKNASEIDNDLYKAIQDADNAVKPYKDKKESNIIELYRTLSYDLLKKVLPPVYRYELKELDYRDKKVFGKIEQKGLPIEDTPNNKSLYETLKEYMGSFLVDPSFQPMIDDWFDQDELLNDKGIISVFDSKPRSLLNILFFMQKNINRRNRFPIKERIIEYDKNNNIKKHTKAVDALYIERFNQEIISPLVQELDKLLFLIVESSSELFRFKYKIKELIKINSHYQDDLLIEINYEVIKKLYRETSEKEDNYDVLQNIIKLYQLMNMYEQFSKLIFAIQNNVAKKIRYSNNKSENYYKVSKNYILKLDNIDKEYILSEIMSLFNKYVYPPGVNNDSMMIIVSRFINDEYKEFNQTFALQISYEQSAIGVSINKYLEWFVNTIFANSNDPVKGEVEANYNLNREWINNIIQYIYVGAKSTQSLLKMNFTRLKKQLLTYEIEYEESIYDSFEWLYTNYDPFEVEDEFAFDYQGMTTTIYPKDFFVQELFKNVGNEIKVKKYPKKKLYEAMNEYINLIVGDNSIDENKVITSIKTLLKEYSFSRTSYKVNDVSLDNNIGVIEWCLVNFANNIISNPMDYELAEIILVILGSVEEVDYFEDGDIDYVGLLNKFEILICSALSSNPEDYSVIVFEEVDDITIQYMNTLESIFSSRYFRGVNITPLIKYVFMDDSKLDVRRANIYMKNILISIYKIIHNKARKQELLDVVSRYNWLNENEELKKSAVIDKLGDSIIDEKLIQRFISEVKDVYEKDFDYLTRYAIRPYDSYLDERVVKKIYGNNIELYKIDEIKRYLYRLEKYKFLGIGSDLERFNENVIYVKSLDVETLINRSSAVIRSFYKVNDSISNDNITGKVTNYDSKDSKVGSKEFFDSINEIRASHKYIATIPNDDKNETKYEFVKLYINKSYPMYVLCNTILDKYEIETFNYNSQFSKQRRKLEQLIRTYSEEMELNKNCKKQIDDNKKRLDESLMLRSIADYIKSEYI